MRVEKDVVAYESPVANTVQDSIRPEAETRARVGTPGTVIRRFSRSRRSRTIAYVLGSTPGLARRQSAPSSEA
ncbi:hypothetical protein GCM10009647_035700 [Streptomyces sanglieri]